jgi:16S rRNA processing protein RimM
MDYQFAGKIQKTFGVSGELLVVWNADVRWDAAQPLFIRIDGLWTPFFIKTTRDKGNKAVIVLEDMETETLAQTLVGKELCVEQAKRNSSNSSNDAPSDHLLGYTVFDNGHAIGIITQRFNFNGNMCFEINAGDGKTTIIPAHPDFIEKEDKRRRALYMQLPEGIT